MKTLIIVFLLGLSTVAFADGDIPNSDFNFKFGACTINFGPTSWWQCIHKKAVGTTNLTADDGTTNLTADDGSTVLTSNQETIK